MKVDILLNNKRRTIKTAEVASRIQTGEENETRSDHTAENYFKYFMWSEMQTTLPMIWTWLTEFILYDNKCYTTEVPVV